MVRAPEGELFVDPVTRWAPFSAISPQLQGQPAIVLPEPGEALRSFTLPGAGEAEGKIAVTVPLDDNVLPRHYEPLTRYLVSRVQSCL